MYHLSLYLWQFRVVNRFCRQSFFVSFFNRFQKRLFRFWKKTIVFKIDPLVLTYRKRMTIVFDVFVKTICNHFFIRFFLKNDRFRKNDRSLVTIDNEKTSFIKTIVSFSIFRQYFRKSKIQNFKNLLFSFGIADTFPDGFSVLLDVFHILKGLRKIGSKCLREEKR